MKLSCPGWNRILLAFSAVAVLTCCAIRAYVRRTSPSIPHRFSFLSGKVDGWAAFGGTWEVSNGAMQNTSDERGAKLLAGSPQWKDYSLEADVKLLGQGDAGLMARASDEEEGVDSYKGYYAGLSSVENQLTTNTSLFLGRVDHSWDQIAKEPVPGGVEPVPLVSSQVGIEIVPGIEPCAAIELKRLAVRGIASRTGLRGHNAGSAAVFSGIYAR